MKQYVVIFKKEIKRVIEAKNNYDLLEKAKINKPDGYDVLEFYKPDKRDKEVEQILEKQEKNLIIIKDMSDKKLTSNIKNKNGKYEKIILKDTGWICEKLNIKELIKEKDEKLKYYYSIIKMLRIEINELKEDYKLINES